MSIFGKELFTWFAIRILYVMYLFVISIIYYFGIEGKNLNLIVPYSEHCLINILFW